MLGDSSCYQLDLNTKRHLMTGEKRSPIQIVNRHHHKATEHDIYIGRGSALGNPYSIEIVGPTRAEVIELYRVWLVEKIMADDPSVIDALNQIAEQHIAGLPVNLVCFCKPRACHGDVIVEAIAAKLASTQK